LEEERLAGSGRGIAGPAPRGAAVATRPGAFTLGSNRMAKGLSKGNKEARKPKKPKPAAAVPTGTVTSAMAGASSPKKKG
jgi:hypothetical protein